MPAFYTHSGEHTRHRQSSVCFGPGGPWPASPFIPRLPALRSPKHKALFPLHQRMSQLHQRHTSVLPCTQPPMQVFSFGEAQGRPTSFRWAASLYDVGADRASQHGTLLSARIHNQEKHPDRHSFIYTAYDRCVSQPFKELLLSHTPHRTANTMSA